MKLNIFKNIAPVALAALVGFSSTSCLNDLDQSIKDPQTNTELDVTGLLAKIYGSLHLTGQTGGAGNPDMSQFDEGNSAFYRRIFEANELCSDECIWTWQGDAGIPELTNISWNSSHGYNELTYYRLMYNVTLCNFYLEETSGTHDAQVLQNRAEVRFVRALMNFHFIDLYGKAPYKTVVDETLPVEKSRTEMFDIVESELLSIIEDGNAEHLADYNGDDANYGRADKVAAKMLLARLYLNAEVYTGTQQWAKAKQYADEVISSKYKLNTTPLNGFSAYEQLFMGDNGENPNARQEIIFPSDAMAPHRVLTAVPSILLLPAQVMALPTKVCQARCGLVTVPAKCSSISLRWLVPPSPRSTIRLTTLQRRQVTTVPSSS